PKWLDIKEKLPIACVESPHGKPKIMLWQGTDLEESHRHHSHWAGLYPWDVIDLRDNHWKEIVKNTYDWWNYKGMGLWSGWCIPWAAMLHARVGSPEMSQAMMDYWQDIYTNQGHGTAHDPNILRRNVISSNPDPMTGRGAGGNRGEIMQMDAGMGAT